MFRKSRTKNIRQRLQTSDSDDDNEQNQGVFTDTLMSNNNLRSDSNYNDNGHEHKIINENNQGTASKTKSILSFDDQEGDDISDFKIKRFSKHSEKTAKKKNPKRNESSLCTNEKKEVSQKEVIVIKELKNITPTLEKPKFIVPDKIDSDEEVNTNKSIKDVQNKFASSFINIPDAKAVYEARKKREQMRQGNGFIPLDNTVRLKDKSSRSSERSRLIREDDDNDMSDDDNLQGKFFSAKSMMIAEEEQRRSEQTDFLRIEQGTSDSEENGNSDEDELERWEQEQIRKGVSAQKVNQMQDELNAVSRFYREEYKNETAFMEQVDMDVDVEIIDSLFTNKSSVLLPDGSLPGSSIVTMEDILSKVELNISRRQENLNNVEDSLKKVEENLSQNKTSIKQLESQNPNLQQRFKMFQEMRLYTRDLLECLNEKIEEIKALEENVFLMWKKRTEKLIKRSRQDVQDEYERCAAVSAGRQWVAPSEDYTAREADREGRRNRRKRERKKNNIVGHFEGLSSDDEETTSQNVIYSDTIASVIEKAKNIFNDADDEFCNIKKILDRFLDWYIIDQKSYEEAYVSLCLPKILAPFITLELLQWTPLSVTNKPIHNHAWYKELLLIGVDKINIDIENSELVNIIPSIVDKVILPKIARMVNEQWNPLSLSESKNLAALLKTFADEYPTVNANSKRFNEILNSIYKKLKASIDEDTFVPIYSKEALEATETGCGAFLNRQFWKSLKLIRSLMCFQNLFSDVCLEELVIEDVINRSSVLALQFSILSDSSIITKCKALVNEIPVKWLESTRPNSYRPLTALLGSIIQHHKTRDKKFCNQMQGFINAVRKE